MKRGITALATALLAGTGLAGTASAEPAPGLNWQPCAENAEVQCASVTVPVDWAKQAKGTIKVAVARRPATDPNTRIGTLVLMPGGPGGSGVDTLLSGPAVSPQVAARFDIVSYDPRGTNRSNPVRCDAGLVSHKPNVVPETGATLADVVAHNKKLGASCREQTGPLLDHIDNVSVARDIDALRAGLGEQQLSLYGVSFGTLAGEMYAERFPSRVRALVLDSVFDHSLSTRRFLETQASNLEDSFTEFANWCAADARCAVHGRDVGQLVDDLYAKAIVGDLHQPGEPGTPLSPVHLLQLITGHFGGPQWTELGQVLATLADQAGRGLARPAAEPAAYAMAAFCADHRADISSQREWVSLWRRQNQLAPHMRAHFAWIAMSGCVGWPARTGNPPHRLDIHGTPPILLLNARHDPATGYNWATNVARQIDDSVLLTYDGWGHGVLNRSECTRNAVDSYLLNSTLPAPGTHCPAVPPAGANR